MGSFFNPADLVPREIACAMGLVPGVILDTKFGRNPDVDAANVDIINMGGTYAGMPVDANGSMLTVAEELQIVCANAADTVAGTGLQVLRVTRLDEDARLVTQDFEMNGGTLNTGVQACRAWRAKGVRYGSSGTNAGDITVRMRTTTANIFAVVAAGVGQTELALITIPALYVGSIYDPTLQIDKGGSAILKAAFFTRPEGQNGFDQKALMQAAGGADRDAPRELYTFPGPCDIKMRVTSASTTNIDTIGTFKFCLVRTG